MKPAPRPLPRRHGQSMRTNGVQPGASTEVARKSPVRVRMQRLGVNSGRLYPPDGDGKNWWRAIKHALGTTSSSFANASLAQLMAAARLPDGPVSETAMNAALALIQAVAPQNEMEAALAVQMACTHAVAVAALSRTGAAGPETVSVYSNVAVVLMRSYAAQLETLGRLRRGGPQRVQVDHLHINDEGRAVIGTVAFDRNGGTRESGP